MSKLVHLDQLSTFAEKIAVSKLRRAGTTSSSQDIALAPL